MHKRLFTVSILFISIFILGACSSDKEPISPNDTFLAPATASLDLQKSKTFVQRSNTNEGEIVIHGQAGANFQTAKIKFTNRVGGQSTDWQNLNVDVANKQFSGKYKLIGGGYYAQIQLIADGKVSAPPAQPPKEPNSTVNSSATTDNQISCGIAHKTSWLKRLFGWFAS